MNDRLHCYDLGLNRIQRGQCVSSLCPERAWKPDAPGDHAPSFYCVGHLFLYIERARAMLGETKGAC